MWQFLACGLLCLFLWGCDRGPFPQVKVTGTLSYEDGSVIPAERIRIWFQSQAPPIDASTHPRPASALVDPATGAFDGATTSKYLDGLVRGEHRVYIDITPSNVIPQEYTSASTSPLRISTDKLPLEIKIPKPKK